MKIINQDEKNDRDIENSESLESNPDLFNNQPIKKTCSIYLYSDWQSEKDRMFVFDDNYKSYPYYTFDQIKKEISYQEQW